jgi:hypothetical protein
MPSNITRGNVEGLIAVACIISPAAVNSFANAAQYFNVPGALTTDIGIKFIMPGGTYYGISIGNVRVSSRGVIEVIFSNCSSTITTPPSGNYTLILGRPSNAALLPVVSF